uniref:Uncharacterized protein n=1 Tax=Moorena producens (strain JHB) TaxID=1454205 RepID=A0A1D9G238_MOOP1
MILSQSTRLIDRGTSSEVIATNAIAKFMAGELSNDFLIGSYMENHRKLLIDFRNLFLLKYDIILKSATNQIVNHKQ